MVAGYKKAVVGSSLVLAVASVLAAVAITEDTQINLLKGTSTVSTHTSWGECNAQAKALANAATQTSGSVTYTCQTERRRVIAAYSAAPPPPPPPIDPPPPVEPPPSQGKALCVGLPAVTP